MKDYLDSLYAHNPQYEESVVSKKERQHDLQKVLVAERGEIAKRFFLSLHEEGIPSVAVVRDKNLGQSWYEFADEVIYIKNETKWDEKIILSAAIIAGANGILLGEGFGFSPISFLEQLTEVEVSYKRKFIFMGPSLSVMRNIQDSARLKELAIENKIDFWDSKERTIDSLIYLDVVVFNGTAVGIKKSAVFKNPKKVLLEESGDEFLNNHIILSVLATAEKITYITGFKKNAGLGSIKFLFDTSSNRLWLEKFDVGLRPGHSVIDQSFSIDLAKSQILLFDGRKEEIDAENVLLKRFIHKEHAISCKIYAEVKSSSRKRILEMDLPTFNGIRCDFGYNNGDLITGDRLVGEIITKGRKREIALARMNRALSELYIKGITTNVHQLLDILKHPSFLDGTYTNSFLKDNHNLKIAEYEEADIAVASVLAAIVENIKITREIAVKCFHSGNLENSVLNREHGVLPSVFHTYSYGYTSEVKLIQLSLTMYSVFFNNKYEGDIELHSRSAYFEDDFYIRLGTKSYPVRVDKRSDSIIIRMQDSNKHARFYKVQVSYKDTYESGDPIGLVRAPFTGSFVRFCEDKFNPGKMLTVGSYVEKEDPIVIISAMKMESTILSPVSGRISDLLEGGDLSRLQLGKTVIGQIVGRIISEQEVLFIVEANDHKTLNENSIKISEKVTGFITHTLKLNPIFSKIPIDSVLFLEVFVTQVLASPEINIPKILKLLLSCFKGYITSKEILEGISESLKKIPEQVWEEIITKEVEDSLYNILNLYYNVKFLFLPNITKGIQLFFELTRYVENFSDPHYRPSSTFGNLMDELFAQYDISQWYGFNKVEDSKIQIALLNLQRSYHICKEYKNIIILLLSVVRLIRKNKATQTDRFITLIRKIYQVDHGEQDDSVAKEIINLGFVSPEANSIHDIVSVFPKQKEIKNKNVIGFELKDFSDQFSSFLRDSIAKIQDLNIDYIKEFKEQLEKKIEFLKRDFIVKEFSSGLPRFLVLGVQSKNDSEDKRYIIFACIPKLELEYDSAHRISGSKGMSEGVITAASLLKKIQDVEGRQKNRIEVIIGEKEIITDIASPDNSILNYNALYNIALKIIYALGNLNLESVIMHMHTRSPFSDLTVYKSYKFKIQQGRILIDIYSPADEDYAYYPENFPIADKKVFEKNKWPVESWVNECFNPATFFEIKINSIDNIVWTNPKTKQEETKPVGSKIYIGKMGETFACFYMKDSRINGGASGNLEGLKYVAALYLAAQKKIPIYIWNDGAGANIKEGMAALHRAGQGFMMNSLLGGNISKDKFISFTKDNPDKTLQALFQEMEGQVLPLIPEGSVSKPFIVAVGVGSSTGLDVYGSSQTSIQVMLDMEESYRVLTGSNVIRSVTGENFTNYQIGGAKVMGNWTGTVDIVAPNKLNLISILRRIQDTFCKPQRFSSIQRRIDGKDVNSKVQEIYITNETLIENNVDDGQFLSIKEEYKGTNSLIGGFARLGGIPTLILGLRTKYGIRFFNTITRVKELLQIANKMHVNQVLIFGDNWFYETNNEKNDTYLAKIDFIKALNKKIGCRVHIITSVKGLNKFAINSSADAIIFVSSGKETSDPAYSEKAPSFIVSSLQEAFDLTHRIFTYFEEDRNGQKVFANNALLAPSIPDDATVPFNMVQSVIIPTFDPASFLEFYKEMNHPLSGPCLITGLAKLNGKTVGVIADQPMIMGGAPDSPGTEKFRVFTEFLNQKRIPLIMLSNAPGFVPGVKQERLRIQQVGGESLDVNVLGEIPVVSVVLNQNFGGRQVHAFSSSLRPGIVYLALSKSIIAVMGATASFDLFMSKQFNQLLDEGKKEEAIQLRQNYIDEYNKKAAATNDAWKIGILDWIIPDIKDLRENLIKGLEVAVEKMKKSTERN